VGDFVTFLAKGRDSPVGLPKKHENEVLSGDHSSKTVVVWVP